MNTPRLGLKKTTEPASERPSPTAESPPDRRAPSTSAPPSSSSASKPAVSKQAVSKPAASKPAASKPAASKPAAGPKPTASSSKKKSKQAKEVADAFASGKVTLGHALGLTEAQKDVMKRRAFALVQESKAELALPILEGLVALDPFDGWVLVALGGLLVDKGDCVVAETLLTRALEVTPGDATAHAMRAEARVKQGKLDDARDDLRAIAAADLSHPAVRRAKALEIALKKL